MTTYEQRTQLGHLMDALVRHAPQIHYAEVRPMETRGIVTLGTLLRVLRTPQGVTMDCSESVTLLCKLAGLNDPNGEDYDGRGYTGTLLNYLPHYENPAEANIGALVVLGPGHGDHVCMVRQPGHDPLLFSHGSEAGPMYVRLHEEAAWHRPPVTFLSIADLQMPEPFTETELWRIVERRTLPNLNVRVKFIFPDGSSQFVTFRPGTWTPENEELTGDHLARSPDLRVFR